MLAKTLEAGPGGNPIKTPRLAKTLVKTEIKFGATFKNAFFTTAFTALN